MLKQRIIDSPRSCQRLCGPFEIDRIPKRNCSDNQIQPTDATDRKVHDKAEARMHHFVPGAGRAHAGIGKAFSFMDSSEPSSVKVIRGQHRRGLAPKVATSAATDRPATDCKHALYRCSDRTCLGNRLSPSSRPIDPQNRGRHRTELESNPPTS